ncbi:MAG: branched-chain amino acid ABC transporter permease [Dehalococcoidia bacterium]|nr:branched-chain amino acid ABC transporter permease [Dehalococcoidia bacterium]
MDTWYNLPGEVLIGGIVNGSTYAVMAVGLSLVYGVTRVFNFAYGSFFVFGAYFAWLFLKLPGFNFGLAILGALLAMFAVGYLCEWASVRPLRWKPKWDITTMMSTLGLAIFLNNVALVSFGPTTRVLPKIAEGNVKLGGFIVTWYEIVVIIIAIGVIVLLELFLKKTRMGMSMQAVSQDMTGAKIVGIPINRVFGYAFALSAVLVSISAILLAPKIFFSPEGGWDTLCKAFVIVAFGGLGSVRGTLFAAFILAMVESAVAMYIGMSWVLVVWFMVLLGVLAIRPKGLAGVWS